jgi:hypothetical protein
MSALITGHSPVPGLELFKTGLAIAQRRYAQLGLTDLLPLERVWIGMSSRKADAFGGYHYPGQGYRHWQMATIITRYGRLDERSITSPLVGLDLVRAYAHDCLHYGSYRVYQSQPLCRPPAQHRPHPVRHQLPPDGRTHVLRSRRARLRYHSQPRHRHGRSHRPSSATRPAACRLAIARFLNTCQPSAPVLPPPI